MRSPSRIWRHFDVWLLAAVVLMTVAGVAMIRSAIGGNENLAELPSQQAVFAIAGFLIVIIVAAIDYRIWAALARPMYIVIIVLLALLTLSGFVGFGAARWFNVGVVLIQPSELAKIVMIIVMADYFSRHQHEIENPSVLLRSLLLMGLPLYLVFSQPDLSTSIVLAVIWIALVWAVGAKFKHLVALGSLAIALPLAAWPFLANYQKARVVTFLFPDPNASFGATYNVNQALISIGSGGWFGQGYGQGTQVQLRFLKVRHTDFIFSAMAEEFGFIGAFLLIGVFLFVIFRCLRASTIARDTFGGLIAFGIAILLLFQGAFNIGMNMNLFPVSGLPLPFFSYGGSSLLSILLGIGLVESVILRHKRIEL